MTTMMLEIPDTLKPMIEPLREWVAEAGAQVERGRAPGREAQYEAFEGKLVEKLAAVERGAHEAALSALDVDAAKDSRAMPWRSCASGLDCR